MSYANGTSAAIQHLFFATGSQKDFEILQKMKIPDRTYIVALTNNTNEMYLLTPTSQNKLEGAVRHLVEAQFPSFTGVILPSCGIHRTDFVQLIKGSAL